jgi:Uma2 family endonuclease
MTSTLSQPLTLEMFLQLPEAKPPVEFANGHTYQKPMPQGKHSRLQLKLCDRINQTTEDQQIALAFPELRCSFGGRSLVPDVAVIAWNRIAFDEAGEVPNQFEIYPDWIIEILSPAQNSTRPISNILHSLDFGASLGWLLDPQCRTVLAFLPKQQPIEFMGQDQLPIPDFIPLELTVDELFGWLKPGSPKP